MWRTWHIVILMALLAGVVSFEVSFISPCHNTYDSGQQSKDEAHHDQASNNCAPREWAPYTAVAWPVRRLVDVDWKPEAITAAATIVLAFLTLVLATATLFLWLSTRRLVWGAEDTAQRQLRAYISVNPSEISRITPTETFHFAFVLLNGGSTPAYSVGQVGELQLTEHPLPENFPFPNLPPERKSLTMVPPRIPSIGHLLATSKFTKDEIIEILTGAPEGGRRLYIFGHVDYIDAFKKKHWTRFCFSFPGWHEAIDAARADRWDDIKIALPKISPPVEF
jgi:hypothetical protein